MEEVALYGFGIKIVHAIMAIGLLWLLARIWNSLTRNKFDDTFEDILKEALPASIYLGLRFLALAIVVAAVIS